MTACPMPRTFLTRLWALGEDAHKDFQQACMRTSLLLSMQVLVALP